MIIRIEIFVDRGISEEILKDGELLREILELLR